MTTPGDAMTRLVDETLEAGGAVDVSALLGRGREAGATATEGWDEAIRLCTAREVQQTWTEWEEVADQAEIALRLQLLVEADEVIGELEDFLTFFFRASAPELYRPAALALGRHSWTHDALLADLRAYAEHRDVGLDEPVELNGQRSRRRFLLASTGRFLATPDDGEPPKFPVAVLSEEGIWERAVADIAVLSVCCHRLLAAGRGGEEFRTMCWRLAGSIHRFLQQGGSQRDLVRAWGQLLRGLEGEDRPRAAALWTESLASFEGREDRSFSDHLATFWEVDHAIAIAAEPDCHLLEAADIPEIGEAFKTSDFRWVARVRYWQWQNRRAGGATDAFPAAGERREAVEPVLRVFVDEVIRRVESGDQLRRAMHRWIARVVETLERPDHWWANPDDARALQAFLVLDAVRFRPPPRQTIARLLEAAGISRPGRSTLAEPAEEGIAGTPWAGFHDLLWHIFRIEGAPGQFPVESESFTSIASAERLLRFVRAGQAVRDLDILVDALEHFIRLELAADPDFELRSFLFPIAARKPHPSLFRALASRASGRTYRTIDGREVDLRGYLESLAREAESPRNGELGSGAGHWFPELHQVRRSLRSICQIDDLFEALEEFADQIDPRIPDPSSRQRGLVDLVGRTVSEEGVLLLDSNTSEVTTSYEALTAGVAEHVRQLREAADGLLETTDVELPEMHRAARNAIRQMELIDERLSPCIPRMDATIITETVDRLGERISAWLHLLDRGVAEPLESVEAGDAEGIGAIFERLAELAGEVDSGPMRTRLFRAAYRALEQRGVAEEAAGPEGTIVEEVDWQFELTLLEEAVATTGGAEADEAWVDFLTDRWEELAEAAMATQQEPRVLALIRRKAFSRLRRRAADGETTQRLRQWLMDRYHVGPLATLIAEAGSRGGPVLPAATGLAVWRLAGNFGHVWLALLVGAVMLLDFGDAWVELARNGDVPGILSTFAIGIGGTFLYLLVDIARKTRAPGAEPTWRGRASRLARVVSFLGVCFLYTLLVTSGLWYLFSGTDIVIHGAGAVLHILVWTGFALFVGVFFGLLTEAG